MTKAKIAVAAALLAVSLGASAQSWPSRPVKIVVPYPPGGAVDVVARKVAQKLSDQLGEPFVIENKPGASGIIGAQSVAKSAPDGYTFMANDMSYSLLPYVFAKLPFDHERDLVPVTTTMFAPYAIAVRADGPYKTLKEMLDAARAQPGKLTFGSGGPASAPHFATESLALAAHVRFTHIPYKGAAEAMTGLIGGQIDMLVASTASLMAQHRAGKARMVAVSGTQRLAALPEVPTFAQAGLADYGILNFNGLWAPKGTPPEIISKLQAQVAKAVASPDTKAFFEAQGGLPGGTKSDEFARLVADTTRSWAPVAAKAGIQKQ